MGINIMHSPTCGFAFRYTNCGRPVNDLSLEIGGFDRIAVDNSYMADSSRRQVPVFLNDKMSVRAKSKANREKRGCII